MEEVFVPPQRKIVWDNLLFFAVTTVLGVIGTPLYLVYHGIAPVNWILFAFYLVAASMSITLGYHRLFAHVTFKASRLVRFLVVFFGAAAFEQSALKWSSQHREHHRFVDTERDPYNIQKGFWYAHIGWLIFWEHQVRYGNVKDLQESAILRHQHRYFILWAGVAGIILPVLIGALAGDAAGALLLAVCTRLTLVYHGTFCINSVCHKFGRRTYDVRASARDHWLAALITNGEGYHNYHHHFPADYRNGVCWYHWDPTKWMIAVLERFGLAWDLKRVSNFRILAAKLRAENERAENWLEKIGHDPRWAEWREKLKAEHEKVREQLIVWERLAREYQELLRRQITEHSEALRRTAFRKMLAAQKQFDSAMSGYQSILKLVLPAQA